MIIKVGDEVEMVNAPSHKPREVLSVDGEYATVEGIEGQVKFSDLFISSLTAEHVARYLLSRKEDNISAVVAWVKEDEKARKPQLVQYVDQIVSNEEHICSLLLKVPAKTYCWNNSAQVAEQVVDHLMKEVAAV
ncbi:MAG: hypothetical protein QG614_621 [Patescibacteria group bacterium]|nr:hypothetical protein [Patescibacteria group bacterium]